MPPGADGQRTKISSHLRFGRSKGAEFGFVLTIVYPGESSPAVSQASRKVHPATAGGGKPVRSRISSDPGAALKSPHRAVVGGWRVGAGRNSTGAQDCFLRSARRGG